ncbi:class I SAM-dependent methyltransferase [Sphingosinicella sp. LHD-64]|uniref:class I SAM-dependent methyltransferase n=1 Tax=Sphingosinicella sp. LHD-64 TaxID=3072139 RepID=UPI00280DA352|nr:class I SAM-dependent methyltransferase [Sphingosinicella sp. LHD-64]MDQ8758280.1 class I SAM-dependent methyltransferase [Sphingosinicella sp. LHD-64]
MSDTSFANRDQAAHWNDLAGRTWAELHEVIDRVLAPIVPLITAELGPIEGGKVLDVGCGAGGLTMAAAKLAGPSGHALGIDISAPLVEAATARAGRNGVANAAFLQADAQSRRFDPQAFDAIVSRFGVMFFADPVAAFRNLRAAARPGATLTCIAWRGPAENDFMTAGRRAAEGLIPDFPASTPDGPGQFGFADDDRVRGILDASGWRDVAIHAIDLPCRFPQRDLRTYITRMGPLGPVFHATTDAEKAEITPKIEAAFASFVHGDEVRFTAACWTITART